MLGNFGVLSFLRSWKLTRFLTTCVSATLFRIWTFSAFLTRTNFLKISSHNLHNVYKNVWHFHSDWFTATPWNFKTNLSYEPVKNLRYNIHCFDVKLSCLAGLCASQIENTRLECLLHFTTSNPTFWRFGAKTSKLHSPLQSFLLDGLKRQL